MLLELGMTYHQALATLDLEQLVGTGGAGFRGGQHGNAGAAAAGGPSCKHGPARMQTVKKDGPSKVRGEGERSTDILTHCRHIFPRRAGCFTAARSPRVKAATFSRGPTRWVVDAVMESELMFILPL